MLSKRTNIILFILAGIVCTILWFAFARTEVKGSGNLEELKNIWHRP